jgi:succinylglutamic semialdehyde dehydrogenase
MAYIHRKPIQFKGNWLNRQFSLSSDPNGSWSIKSPADFKDEIGVASYNYQDIDEAIEGSAKAYQGWRKLTLEKRAEYLKKYQDALKKRKTDFAEVMARETGKPLWEAHAEVAAMIGKVDITLNESMKLIEPTQVEDAIPSVRGVTRYRPLGVLAVIGPFNFPGHLANGHIIPALATGNTVIFKPSEKTPFTGQLMAECFAEAGFPSGVFNLLQGEKEVGRRLCVHENVAGVLFTGSYEVGTRIKQDTLQQHWKLLALEMGGKNSAIVWDDADIENALLEVLFGAFVTTGQRCSATSRVILHKKIAAEFISRFHEKSKAFSIGHPFENPFMGPLIESGAVDRYMKFMGIAAREGAEVLMRGRALNLDHFEGNYVSPSICVVADSSVEAARKSIYQQTEIFGPNVAFLEVDDLDHAIALANVTQYGLAASVFTKDKSVYERCLDDVEAGLLNLNKSTVGASSRLPFGGLKKSGNFFPTALTATRYCTHPLASLEAEEPQPDPSKFPGLNW